MVLEYLTSREGIEVDREYTVFGRKKPENSTTNDLTAFYRLKNNNLMYNEKIKKNYLIENYSFLEDLNKEYYPYKEKEEKKPPVYLNSSNERDKEGLQALVAKYLQEAIRQPALTPEEIETKRQEDEKVRIELERKREEERRRQNLWRGIYDRFGMPQTSLPTLAEEEMQRLLEPAVDTTAGKWYIHLRGRGQTLALPQSMDGQFSTMMEEQVRQFMQQTYNSTTRLPLSSLFDIVNSDLGDLTRQVIATAEGERREKNFPLGRVYGTVSITGLKAKLSPLEATTYLVYGLIGRQKKKVEAAEKVFEKGKIDLVREFIAQSSLTSKHIFRDISPYLTQISQGDEDAARKVLSYFRDNLKTEEVSDLVAGVEALFNQEERFSHLLVKMQDGRYEDMFDNSRLMACTFLPRGIHRQAALVYCYDPDIGLLHMVPRSIDQLAAPIGVAILVNASDDVGNKWLVVDSVEGGQELGRVRDKLWMPAVYQGVLGVARDINAGAIMFNSSVYNGRPKRFLEYISKQAQKSTVRLTKAGMRDYSQLGISQLNAKEALEAWQKSTNNELNGYVSQLN